ncbi:MAG: cyclase family protein [Bacteroidetes bacterium]|nr:cyclase family protein [Bacteroidota bacterium]
MKATIEFNSKTYHWNTDEGIDLSIPVSPQGPSAYGIPNAKFSTYVDGGFIGNVNQGGSCNVNDILINPHGNGSHTECVGHISKEPVSINKTLKQELLIAELISVTATEIIEPELLNLHHLEAGCNALIIRTLPNSTDKKQRNWYGTNPPYLSVNAMKHLNENGIEHLLVDLPSVDAETDGKLVGHHAFFGYPENKNSKKTITELIYIPDSVADGVYLLNLQVAPIENDAAPCKPIIYQLR